MNGSFPPDIRIQKQVEYLLGRNCSIDLFTLRGSTHSISQGIYKKLKFLYVEPVVKYSVTHLFSRLFIFNPFYAKALHQILSKNKYDYIHVHDFDYFPTVLITCKISKVDSPIVADLHENMPAALKIYRKNSNSFCQTLTHYLIENYYLWKTYEFIFLHFSYKIITVAEESNTRLLKYGIKRNKIVKISNNENYCDTSNDTRYSDIFKNHWVVSYVGGGGKHRGLEYLIKSLPLVSEKIPNLLCLIVGLNGKLKNELFRLTVEKGVYHVVKFIKWVPQDEALEIIKRSHLGVIPHIDCEHTQTTIPHKFFQHLIHGVPLLTSDCKPFVSYFKLIKTGMTFEANSYHSLSDEIYRIYKDYKTIRVTSEALSEFISKYHSCDAEYKNFESVYPSLRN